MLGVGDHAPSINRDVQLGDVMVNAPRDGNGGIFQYDLARLFKVEVSIQ